MNKTLTSLSNLSDRVSTISGSLSTYQSKIQELKNSNHSLKNRAQTLKNQLLDPNFGSKFGNTRKEILQIIQNFQKNLTILQMIPSALDHRSVDLEECYDLLKNLNI